MRFRSIDFEKLLDDDKQAQVSVETTSRVNKLAFVLQLAYNSLICVLMLSVAVYISNQKQCCVSNAFTYPVECDLGA